MKAVFIDRDGTIGGGSEVILPGQFAPYPGSLQAIALLKRHGFLAVAFTNQPGIASGAAQEADFARELAGFGLDESLICPHAAAEGCPCRKPSPYMLEQAIKKHGLEKERCFVVGDRWSDMCAAQRAGLSAVLVLTGEGQNALTKYAHLWEKDRVAYIAQDLAAAAQWIVR